MIGTGPASIHMAVDLSRGWCNQIGLLNRKSERSEKLKLELASSGNVISTKVEVQSLEFGSGSAVISQFYEGFDYVDNRWDTVVICTPCNSYASVVRSIDFAYLTKLTTIILLSPGLGSNLLVEHLLGENNDRIEVISFSTYYGASIFPLSPQSETFINVLVKGLKRKVFIGSNKVGRFMPQHVNHFIVSHGINAEQVEDPIEAECRSITTYVHPPFFINHFSLGEIFSPKRSTKFMYKLYPEGPITQHVIATMIALWKEISQLLSLMGARPINLLQFLNDDNYPVHEQTLSRPDIEGFVDEDPIKQNYLLYIRYTSILIDPFSEPDEDGKYLDFSAFPYRTIKADTEGKWIIPRVPYEDYKKLKIMYGLGQRLGLSMTQSEQFIHLFEEKIHRFVYEDGYDLSDPSITNDNSLEDVAIIWEQFCLKSSRI
nr:opine metallophore biosynthesis dehydrogenase [Paenibacillus sp. GSMTC-2017]